jgi:hypothetical protein
MYTQQIQDYLAEIARLAEVPTEDTRLLDESLSCYLSIIARSMKGTLTSNADLFGTSIHLMALSIGLTQLEHKVEAAGSHYLVAMGMEQTGDFLARSYGKGVAETCLPLDNDYWYRLTLAFLHYMAGGFRVQAVSVLRHLGRIANDNQNVQYKAAYETGVQALWSLFRGKESRASIDPLEIYLFGEQEPSDIQGERIYRLAQKIRQRRQSALSDLGLENENNWLSRRGIALADDDLFWRNYLEKLESRGFTNFTDEQIGPGFDSWLIPDTHLLVLLPTGSGKTLIAELKTALSLAQGQQVIWMLPTRSLVRQTKRELSTAFSTLGVDVEELPSTEDFIPLFSDDLPDQRIVAATTPEKIAALVRSNPGAVSRVGLVVLDEAQILFENRGTTAEYALQEIHRLAPACKFILMSAFDDYLERFRNFTLRLLGQSAIELTSETRPTRRINGIITNYRQRNVIHPMIAVYPAGAHSEKTEIQNAYEILLSGQSFRARPGPIDLAKSVATAVIGSQIRAVMFVGVVASTEAQANAIAEESQFVTQLPETDLARLRTELGRDSAILQPALKGVAPHHAGLIPLEQHIVEKWARQKIVNLVVATQSLAQGVNLPFDMSIVSFLKQTNLVTGEQENVPVATVMNMLGRAGRAGQVSDGLCLVAMPTYQSDYLPTLNRAKRYFFRGHQASKEFLGLAKLLDAAKKAQIRDEDWLFRLDGIEFAQTQTLISFSLIAGLAGDQLQQGIRDRLLLYPSVQDLVGKKELEEVIVDLASDIEPLISNVLSVSNGDRNIVDAMARTGMPLEIIRFMLDALRGDFNPRNASAEQALTWADEIVSEALQLVSARPWYSSLMKGIDSQRMMAVISLWRSGAPIVELEREFQLSTNERKNRIETGKFLNHKISMIAQFWGTLAVCDEVLFPDGDLRRPLEPFQTFVREGVDSLLALEWFNQLGGVDRVLAHRLASITVNQNLPNNSRSLSRYIQRRINRWKDKSEIIPIELNNQETAALLSILDE